MDLTEKFPEGFRVTLDIVVSPKEKPRPDQNMPWQNFSNKSLNPKILFANKDEQHQVMEQFGRYSFLSL